MEIKKSDFENTDTVKRSVRATKLTASDIANQKMGMKALKANTEEYMKSNNYALSVEIEKAEEAIENRNNPGEDR